MVNGTRSGAVLGLLAFLSASASAQTFEGKAEVVVVEVPVHVVMDGQPVRGLTADDFTLYDDGAKQEIIGFEVIDLEALTEAGWHPELPVAARRHFLLLFDLSFAEPSAIVRARAAARDLVARSLHPSDLAAVATYTRSRGPQLVLGFTSDRRQIAAAIESLGLPQLYDRAPDPLGFVIAELQAMGAEAALAAGQPDAGGPLAQAAGGSPRGQIDGLIMEHLKDIVAYLPGTQRAQLQNQVLDLTRSFADLGQLLAGVQGRKHVVYFSEGFDSELLLGTTDVQETESMNRAAESGEYWMVDSDRRYGSSRMHGDLAAMVEQFRRADATIQAVDIGGLRASADLRPYRTDSGQNALFIMARETGGELYRNFNDLGEAMGRLLADTGVTYLLAFQPSGGLLADTYHPLKVKVKGLPRKARVHHRPGYYPPRPYDWQSPSEIRLRAAQTVVRGEAGGEIPLAVVAPPLPGPEALARVPVLLEVDGAALLRYHPGATLGAELYAYALDREGTVRDYFAKQLTLDLARTGEVLAQEGLAFLGTLDLPAGDYSLRVLVRNAQTGHLGLAVVALSVPDFGRAVPALYPPLFLADGGRRLLLRDRGAEAAFEVAGEPFLPAASPALTPGQEARLCLLAFNLGAGDLALEGRVVDAAGRPVDAAAVALAGREGSGAGGGERLLATLTTAGLGVGEYTLHLALADPGSGARLTTSASFRVVER